MTTRKHTAVMDSDTDNLLKQQPKLQAALPAKSYTFSSLGISAPLQAALKSMSIQLPTEVQAACIPPLLEGKIKNLIAF